MKTATTQAIVLALSAWVSGHALAGNPSVRGYQPQDADTFVSTKTRAEVQAELIEAQRTGEITSTVAGQRGKKMNELYPDRYPAKPVIQGKTRAEVQAELVEAQRTGNIVSTIAGQSGKKLNELYPERYSAKAVLQGKSPTEVQAQ